jgi:hypothetical protein
MNQPHVGQGQNSECALDHQLPADLAAGEPTTGAANQPPSLLCPSAQPEMQGSRLLGVVGGTPGAPEIAYLNQFVPVTAELLALTGPAKPTQLLRFAAPCQEKKCSHFDGAKCNLVTRIVQILPAVVDALPACLIRPTCRWYEQEGREACLRCPQVITQVNEPDDRTRLAAEGHL